MTAHKKTLDEKLARLNSGKGDRRDFILADAKDADMAFGLAATGTCSDLLTGPASRRRTLAEYREQIRAIVAQGIVDLMLTSASTLEKLAIEERLFESSRVTPAARANDTTDIWLVRGGRYGSEASRPFRSATIDHIKYGKLSEHHQSPAVGADLGLYSVTFTNDVERDLRSLEAYREFRLEAERKHFRHFLEVFNPPSESGLSPNDIGGFLNDHVVRALAGVTTRGRPLFLKIPYNGPAALEELVSWDSRLIVGILGGAAGTTRDAFQLLHDAQKHGARVALFGRKINQAEHPLAFIEHLRAITNGDLSPADAVRRYHDELKKSGLRPSRPLEDDLQVTMKELK